MKPSKFGVQGSLKYVKAANVPNGQVDATRPLPAGHRIIAHVCNDAGKWGAGFTGSLSKRWDKPEKEYRRWYRSQNFFKLGEIQEIGVQSDTLVVNMVAQHGIGKDEDGNPPIRYDALRQCLAKVGNLAVDQGSSVNMPRIGCGLGGGDWKEVEKIIFEELVQRGLRVFIYDLSKS